MDRSVDKFAAMSLVCCFRWTGVLCAAPLPTCCLSVLFVVAQLHVSVVGSNSVEQYALQYHNNHRSNAGLQQFQWDDSLGQFRRSKVS